MRNISVKKFGLTGVEYEIQFNDTDMVGADQVVEELHRSFQSIIDRITDGMPGNDMVRIILITDQLDYPVSLPFMRNDELTVEKLLAQVQRVLQSHETFTLNDTVFIHFQHVSMPKPGGGRLRKGHCFNIQERLRRKRTLICIKNKDNMCAARAIVVAKAKIDQHPEWNTIRDHKCTRQEQLAVELCEKAGVSKEQKCGLAEIQKFRHVLPEHQINVDQTTMTMLINLMAILMGLFIVATLNLRRKYIYV